MAGDPRLRPRDAGLQVVCPTCLGTRRLYPSGHWLVMSPTPTGYMDRRTGKLLHVTRPVPCPVCQSRVRGFG